MLLRRVLKYAVLAVLLFAMHRVASNAEDAWDHAILIRPVAVQIHLESPDGLELMNPRGEVACCGYYDFTGGIEGQTDCVRRPLIESLSAEPTDQGVRYTLKTRRAELENPYLGFWYQHRECRAHIGFRIGRPDRPPPEWTGFGAAIEAPRNDADRTVQLFAKIPSTLRARIESQSDPAYQGGVVCRYVLEYETDRTLHISRRFIGAGDVCSSFGTSLTNGKNP